MFACKHRGFGHVCKHRKQCRRTIRIIVYRTMVPPFTEEWGLASAFFMHPCLTPTTAGGSPPHHPRLILGQELEICDLFPVFSVLDAPSVFFCGDDLLLSGTAPPFRPAIPFTVCLLHPLRHSAAAAAALSRSLTFFQCILFFWFTGKVTPESMVAAADI